MITVQGFEASSVSHVNMEFDFHAIGGGAIYVGPDSSLHIGNDCKFHDNHAPFIDGASAGGGAVFANEAELTVGDRCTFSSNTAVSFLLFCAHCCRSVEMLLSLQLVNFLCLRHA